MSIRIRRWSGWLLLVGSAIFIVGNLLGFVLPDSATSVQLVFLFIGALLVLGGLPAFYRKQARQVGWLGLCGFIALLLAEVLLGIVVNILFAVVSSAGSAQIFPLILLIAFVGAALGLIGGLLFGVMTIRARVFPAAIGWFLIVAGILNLAFISPLPGGVGGIISEIVFSLVFGWMGYLLALRTSEVTAPSPA